MKLSEKIEKRAALLNQQRAILDANPSGMSADEETKYENIGKEFDNLSADISREQKLIENERQLKEFQSTPPVTNPANKGDDKDAKKEAYASAFENMLRKGRMGVENHPRGSEFMNALEAGTDSEGGYLVPEEWASSIISGLGELNVVRRYASSMSAGTDKNIPIATGRAAFTWIDEEGSYSTNDPSFGSAVIGAHKVGGIIKISEELLKDNAFNLEGYLAAKASEEFDQKEEEAFCTGDGSGKPTGLFETTAVAGVSLTGYTSTASETLVTADELIETFYALSRRYRSNATWLTSDAVAKQARKLKDDNNNYLWSASLRDGEPDRLMGRPFEVTDSAPMPAAGKKSIIFGDLKYYQIIDRLGVTVQRLNQLYAENGQFGFKFMKRVDAELTLAPAVTFFQQKAGA